MSATLKSGYDIETMEVLLQKVGVRRVIMRYEGAEGKGGVSAVNYLSEGGVFLGYGEIASLRIPENELCSLGEDFLVSVKRDWFGDWGGQGEIVWELGESIKVFHDDRYEDLERISAAHPSALFSGLIEGSGAQGSEFEAFASFGASFVYSSQKIEFYSFRAQDEDEVFKVGLPLQEALSLIFRDVVSFTLKEAGDGFLRAEDGEIEWVKAAGFDVGVSLVLERYEKEFFEIPRGG